MNTNSTLPQLAQVRAALDLVVNADHDRDCGAGNFCSCGLNNRVLEAATRARDALDQLQSEPPAEADREAIARIIYDIDPIYESGESVEGFIVSPGGNLSWEQFCDQCAEFGDDRLFHGWEDQRQRILKAADAILKLPTDHERRAGDGEAPEESDVALAWHDGFMDGLRRQPWDDASDWAILAGFDYARCVLPAQPHPPTDRRLDTPESPGRAGEDWKLVPRAPTAEMFIAAYEGLVPAGDAKACWRAMYDAAPTPPASPVGEDSQGFSSVAPKTALPPTDGQGAVIPSRDWRLEAMRRFTAEVVDAGAKRLVSFEDGCVWPDSWDVGQVAQARVLAERCIRSALCVMFGTASFSDPMLTALESAREALEPFAVLAARMPSVDGPGNINGLSVAAFDLKRAYQSLDIIDAALAASRQEHL